MSTTLASAAVQCRLSKHSGRALLSMRGQHLVTDAPPPLGGPNEAANPVDLLLSSLAACAVLVCERVARELGLPLHDAAATVAGDFDPRGVCGEAVDPRFQAFRVRLQLDGPDAAQSAQLLQAFRTRCPIFATLSRAATVEVSLA